MGELTRFVILAMPRSGSNMLCTLLDSHPAILCHHELFNPRGVFYALRLRDTDFHVDSLAQRDRDPLGFFEKIWTHALGHRAVGFKMTRRQQRLVFDAVLERPEIIKIVLRRGQPLRRYVSVLIAEHLDEWEVYDRRELTAQRPTMHVDLDAFREALAFEAAYYRDIEHTLAATGQRAIHVQYEDLTDQRVLDAMLDQLGVPAHPLRASSIRQNPQPLHALIANYHEVCERLRGTALDWVLRDG